MVEDPSRLVVEAVRDLVPDDGSDGAEVDGRVDVGVEEGRLKDSRGEHNLVEHGVIVRVHPPAESLIHWFVGSLVHRFVRSLVHSLVRSFIGSFMGWFVHWLVHGLVRSFIGSFVLSR